MSNSSFRRDIQGLRAVAVLIVVLFHAHVPFFDGGFVGVDVFFVISGFVIGRSLLREVERTGTIRLRDFYKRRVRRLLPAFWAMAIVTFAFTALFLAIGDVQRTAAQTGIAAVFSVANLVLYRNSNEYFAVSEELNPFLHTWSLAVEEQFYLVAPALMLALIVISRCVQWSQRSVLIGGVGLVSIVSLAASVGWVSQGDTALAFYSPIARFWEIAAGVGLAMLHIRQSRARGWFAALAVGAIFVATFQYGSHTQFPGFAAALPVIATLLIVAWAPSSTMLTKVLEHEALVWIGDRSYGWYLWHWPFVVVCRQVVNDGWVALLLASLLALLPAMASYRFIEQRIAHGPAWSVGGIRLAVVTAGSVVMLTIAGSVVQAGADKSWGLDLPTLEPDGLAYVNGCDYTVSAVPPQCVFAPPGTSQAATDTIVVVGDSHAASLADGVIDAGHRAGYTVVVATAHACPFIDVPVRGSCDQYRSTAWDAIERHQPRAVVLVQNSVWYLLASETAEPRVQRTDGEWVRSTDEVVGIWTEGISTTREALSRRDIALVSVDAIPVFSNDSFEGAATLLSPTREPDVVSVQEYERSRAPIVAAEHESLLSGHWVDPGRALCSQTTCSTVNAAGDSRYFDGGHLNRSGSLELTESFVAVFDRVLGAEQ